MNILESEPPQAARHHRPVLVTMWEIASKSFGVARVFFIQETIFVVAVSRFGEVPELLVRTTEKVTPKLILSERKICGVDNAGHENTPFWH
jgi:hypothetical protein